jgi:hypothetical protein
MIKTCQEDGDHYPRISFPLMLGCQAMAGYHDILADHAYIKFFIIILHWLSVRSSAGRARDS